LTESKKPSPSFAGSRLGALPMMMSPVADSVITLDAAREDFAGGLIAAAPGGSCQRATPERRITAGECDPTQTHADHCGQHDRDREDGPAEQTGAGSVHRR
jgi:hypothetical protein